MACAHEHSSQLQLQLGAEQPERRSHYLERCLRLVAGALVRVAQQRQPAVAAADVRLGVVLPALQAAIGIGDWVA
jgi:hypothetical protein